MQFTGFINNNQKNKKRKINPRTPYRPIHFLVLFFFEPLPTHKFQSSSDLPCGGVDCQLFWKCAVKIIFPELNNIQSEIKKTPGIFLVKYGC